MTFLTKDHDLQEDHHRSSYSLKGYVLKLNLRNSLIINKPKTEKVEDFTDIEKSFGNILHKKNRM